MAAAWDHLRGEGRKFKPGQVFRDRLLQTLARLGNEIQETTYFNSYRAETDYTATPHQDTIHKVLA